ncbi:hypothetical protein ACFQMA_00845 [Halosimplex aquaticum]|uniref:Uncharacterized protein n=1 Tax=Halosimplex aquaticum TaxID=3026162 RepID=A0ABD5XTG2_9EURY|nr:hypothetical protein [Halosimplex aquaticum]
MSEYAANDSPRGGVVSDSEELGAEASRGRRRWATIVLEECGDGWRATQAGVAAEGRGETAADAAAAYCQRIAETGDRNGGREGAR